MTVTVVATAGAANANSYLSVAAADDLADDYLGPLNWTAATTDNKGRALITATRYLDQLEWLGSRATTTQALAWPRSGAACGEWSFDDDEIPPPIKRGCFELAGLLLASPTLLTGAGQRGNAELIPGIPNASLKSARVDVISLEFRDGAVPNNQNALNVLPGLRQTLGCLCLSTPIGGSRSIRVVRS
jgi:hypothetical protein